MQPQLAALINAGKVQFIFKHFPVVGQESVSAAEAAECAADQGRFWMYHDHLFEHQQGENRGTFNIANLKQFARALGLEPSTFDACLDSHSPDERIREDIREAEQHRLPGTPSFLVNGQFIASQDNQDVLRAVEEAVAPGTR